MATVTIEGPNGLTFPINTGLFINNNFKPASSGRTLDVINPASGKHLTTVAAAQSDDIDVAVNAAQDAFRATWRDTLPAKRGQLLNKLADLIERDADQLATIESVDAGILFMDSKGLHVPQAVETLRYFAGWADKISGQALHIPNGMAYTRREPLGVCAAIVPWNSPLYACSTSTVVIGANESKNDHDLEIGSCYDGRKHPHHQATRALPSLCAEACCTCG
jgi:aldehyde dehydrogenase (NAD+)